MQVERLAVVSTLSSRAAQCRACCSNLASRLLKHGSAGPDQMSADRGSAFQLDQARKRHYSLSENLFLQQETMIQQDSQAFNRVFQQKLHTVDSRKHNPIKAVALPSQHHLCCTWVLLFLSQPLDSDQVQCSDTGPEQCSVFRHWAYLE